MSTTEEEAEDFDDRIQEQQEEAEGEVANNDAVDHTDNVDQLSQESSSPLSKKSNSRRSNKRKRTNVVSYAEPMDGSAASDQDRDDDNDDGFQKVDTTATPDAAPSKRMADDDEDDNEAVVAEKDDDATIDEENDDLDTKPAAKPWGKKKKATKGKNKKEADDDVEHYLDNDVAAEDEVALLGDDAKIPKKSSSKNKKAVESTRKSSPRRRARPKRLSEENPSFESPTKKKTKKGKASVNVVECTCPHCGKVCTTKFGLKYHLDHYVCRIEQCTDPELIAKSRRRRGPSQNPPSPTDGTDDNKKTKKSKKERGKLEDRTCTTCGRVFTSVLGARYHMSKSRLRNMFYMIVGSQLNSFSFSSSSAWHFHFYFLQAENKVCHTEPLPFAQLDPGDRFVTKFGVVEVVKDDRATANAELPSNIKFLRNSYNNAKSQIEGSNKKLFNFKATHLRNRRNRINSVYENKNPLSKATIEDAYFGGKKEQHRPLRKMTKADPMAPEGSYPDRIVECVLIPDKRRRVVGEGKTTLGMQLDANFVAKQTRLFLRRDALTEKYIRDNPKYSCMDCGQQFTSFPGLQYHSKIKSCIKKTEASIQKRVENIAKIDKAARKIADSEKIARIRNVEGPNNHDKVHPSDGGAASLTWNVARDGSGRFSSNPNQTKKKVWKQKKKKEMGIYPECLITLGFKFVKEDIEITDEMVMPPAEFQDNLRMDGPDVVLENLKQKFSFVQRVADDQKFGAMYQGVFKALKYKVPRKKRKLDASYGPGGKRKRRQKKEKPPPPPPPPKPLPPIIDIQALADEVDSGRYPSIKRFKEINKDECCMCKDGGELLCCDFCSNSEHLACIRKKFTVKDPEPKDDFMCHICIGIVLARRRRAEKRRVEKQEKEQQRIQQIALDQQRRDDAIQKGKEYEYMAQRGQKVNELVELLQDAQNRLHQCLATSAMNNTRRRMMGFGRPK